MAWYIQFTIYIVSTALSLITIYQIDFNRFMRVGRSQFAILVWLIISLALGYLIGSLFVELGEQLSKIK